MLLEAKLSVCEQLVRETGERHHLTVLGFKSLLPATPGGEAPTPELVTGVWRTGFNPLVHEGDAQGEYLYEERLHYLADGRVCGLQQIFDPALGATDEARTFVLHPFSGTWTVSGRSIVEDYTGGRAPKQLGKATQRKRAVSSLLARAASHTNVERRSLRLGSEWPGYYELVPPKKAAALRELQEGMESMAGELPAYCFDVALPGKEKAAK